MVDDLLQGNKPVSDPLCRGAAEEETGATGEAGEEESARGGENGGRNSFVRFAAWIHPFSERRRKGTATF